MPVYYLFGYLSDDIGTAKDYLENVFSCEFHERESSYHGVYYQCGEMSGEHFMLKENIDLLDDEAAEPDFPSYRILLYLNEVESRETLEKKLVDGNSFVLLRKEKFD